MSEQISRDLEKYYESIGPCIDHGRNRSLDPLGYARVSVGGKARKLHRIVFAESNGLTLGDIDGLVIRHKCDNPRCIRPDHLVSGTFADNTRDMHERGRFKRPKSSGTARKLTDDQIIEIRKNPDGELQRELAVRFGVCPVTIHNIQAGKLYRDVSCKEVGNGLV